MWMEPFIILGVGAMISLGLFAYYQPKINKIKEQYEEFSEKMGDNFQGIDSFINTKEQMDFMQQDQFDQFSQWSMDEAIKAITPFDHGGYVQGNGFNPSDTMAYESAMDSMNHSMDSMNSSMDINNGF